ncbi:MAG TPA: RNA 2',3'-cyclic phosphodiesterase [Spirochaetia bacterium]|nr:RNA 2',3'-cyclic phosphodiesterase [Spirochaetia bacterium]
MRVFAALPLPAAAIASILESLEPLRQRHPRLRWVNADAMHVTLHFFGEVSESGVQRLRAVFERPVMRRRPLRVRLASFGQFPPQGRARVIWVGMDDGVDQMREYWQQLELLIAAEGWERDPRGFSPHITMARVGSSFLDPEWGTTIHAPRLEFELTECVLYESVLERSGPRYLPLARAAFEERPS